MRILYLVYFQDGSACENWYLQYVDSIKSDGNVMIHIGCILRGSDFNTL